MPAGDMIVTQANSKELIRYGIKIGLSNYAAAYATGLLLARRHLSRLGISSKYQGCSDPQKAGEDFLNDEVDENRPFKAILDIGLARSTTGAKVFGAMKGALDGGINIPHDPKRFVGNNKKSKEYDPEVHRKHIFGLHVADYMKYLEEKDPQAYQRQFAQYITAGVTSDSIEAMYLKAHEGIRADPTTASVPQVQKTEKTKLSARKLKKLALKATNKRKQKIQIKKDRFLAQLAASASA